MATRKQVSDEKAKFIAQKNKATALRLKRMDEMLYDSVIGRFTAAYKKYSESSTQNSMDISQAIVQLTRGLQNFTLDNLPSVLDQTVANAYSVSDLNQKYFSTMMDSGRLDLIKDKTEDILNRKLGVDSNGRLLKGGFLDKTLTDPSVQRQVINSVRKAVANGQDTTTLKNTLQSITLGDNGGHGLFQRYYNTFGSGLLNTIDRSNSNIYAADLGLRHFYYAGGLIKTSRPFCMARNGKIFSTAEAQLWKRAPEIVKMYGSDIDQYRPLEDMGGYGCLHNPDYITEDLAKRMGA